ncbi:hypothetical protein THIAE_04455 [Thiomicrospira aerophila AL3]|uniref:Diguanylate cyclase n=1 Tax=Thiomicrospira aerophila AL3 TaxID=717772 RepID=W0DYA7_9GAMM|nr:EAL domain-containing protein [Thiomicrospira aerophila]AHF02238.1 hypothetical protein THIAE_04455 [Thiomicrospira aerophila AL3]
MSISSQLQRIFADQPQLQAALLSSLVDYAHEAVGLVSDTGRLILLNPAFEGFLKFPAQDLLNRRLWFLRSLNGRRGISSQVQQALIEQGVWAGEYRIQTGLYDFRDIMLTLVDLAQNLDAHSGDASYTLVIFHDLSQQKHQELQLKQLANFDKITGLPSRQLFSEKVEWLKQNQQNFKFGLLCIDLDGFKLINDQYGHDIGDKLLKKVAMRLSSKMRSEDILSRFGGDEFLGLVHHVPDDPQLLAILLNRLLAAASEPMTINGIKLQVSCSIGVTLADNHAFESVDILLRQADHAMYQAKIEGKNRYHVFDPAQEAWQKERHSHFKRMREAMHLDELRVVYLPIVSLKTGELKGAEALVRWQHPEHGLLDPRHFMPIIEDHMVEVELGWWVMDRVLTDMQQWQTLGFDCRVNVNVSSRQLEQGDFNERLFHKLSHFNAPQPFKLELEILESGVFESLPDLSGKLNELKSHDIRLAVDDFGTGYSSFDYLRKLSLDSLKVDRSFVANMLESAEDRAILASMIALGHAFHLDVVAEGVETLEHAKQLQTMGCDYAQGYGIAKPMPANELMAWAKTWSIVSFG